MKKIITLLLMLCIILGCLAGCGGGDAKETLKEPAEGMTTVWKKVRMYPVDAEGVKGTSYVELERNEYGFNTTRTGFDADGKVMDGMDNVAYGTEKFDENGKLISYSSNTEGFDFSYDEEGKISKIDVRNEDQVIIYSFEYSDREDAKYVRVGSDFKIHYNEDLNVVCEEDIDSNGEFITTKTNVYDVRGLLIQSEYIKKGTEYHKEFSYDENDRLIKEIGYKMGELWFEESYIYSEKGNLLTLIGLEYGQGLSPKGEEYLREEYTDDDYDEQGRCKYYYGEGEKRAYSDIYTYEYADEGWLLKEIRDIGTNIGTRSGYSDYTEFDENGNVVTKYTFGGVYVFEYEEFEIIDDELLVALYKFYGDKIM